MGIIAEHSAYMIQDRSAMCKKIFAKTPPPESGGVSVKAPARIGWQKCPLLSGRRTAVSEMSLLPSRQQLNLVFKLLHYMCKAAIFEGIVQSGFLHESVEEVRG